MYSSAFRPDSSRTSGCSTGHWFSRPSNERSGGVLNRTCLPSDIIAFVVFCRLRYRLTLRDLSEIMALRGIEVSHEAVRDWEAKLLPIMGHELRKRRHDTRRLREQLASGRDLPKGPWPLVLPVSGDRPGRKPGRRHAQRSPGHAGSQGLLPFGAGYCGLPAGPGDDGRAWLIPEGDPHRAGPQGSAIAPAPT